MHACYIAGAYAWVEDSMDAPNGDTHSVYRSRVYSPKPGRQPETIAIRTLLHTWYTLNGDFSVLQIQESGRQRGC